MKNNNIMGIEGNDNPTLREWVFYHIGKHNVKFTEVRGFSISDKDLDKKIEDIDDELTKILLELCVFTYDCRYIPRLHAITLKAALFKCSSGCVFEAPGIY